MGYLTGWRSCPRCRARLENDGKRATCGDCGSAFYAPPDRCSFGWVARFLHDFAAAPTVA